MKKRRPPEVKLLGQSPMAASCRAGSSEDYLAVRELKRRGQRKATRQAAKFLCVGSYGKLGRFKLF